MINLIKINAYSKAFLNKIGLLQYPEVIKYVKQNHLSYLGSGALYDLYQQIKKIEKNGIPGLLIEAGCALGGSAIVISQAKGQHRVFKVYDVFGMIPPPGDEDGTDIQNRYQEIKSGQSKGIDGDQYYGYIENLELKVKENFEKAGFDLRKNEIHLVKGLFQDTIKGEEPVAFAHIDGDWYESVKICLERIVPRLSLGGIVAVDDYFCWSGCQKAVDEYFEGKKDQFKFIVKERLFIKRLK